MLTPTATEDDFGHDHFELVAALARPRVRNITRRRVLSASVAMAGAALAGIAPVFGQQGPLRQTVEDALGPFYPLAVPADHDFDLTQVAGKDGRAKGQLLYVSGRVMNTKGEPVADALIEIWQANAVGRYDHPGDDNKNPLDLNFQGYARIRTGADGSYQLKTIKPGEYGSRTPHIHFDVKGKNTRVVTQMYFENEAKNATDGLLSRRSPASKKTLISSYGKPAGRQEKDALVALWDVVLADG